MSISRLKLSITLAIVIALVVGIASLRTGTPAQAGTPADPSHISAGLRTTCVVDHRDIVYCWGANESGGVGLGVTDNLPDAPFASITQPERVFSLNHEALSVATGSGSGEQGFSCVVTAAGTVKCWGTNSKGELGDDKDSGTWSPVPVHVCEDATCADPLGSVDAVAAGGTTAGGHACALTTGGAVLCWGYNNYGQLGDDSTTDSSTPVQVSGLTSGIVAIAAGGNHTCALTDTNAVKCWGRNTQGQLGDNSTTDRDTPVTVASLGGAASAIGANLGDHTCAVVDGGARCWGLNADGQLGDNSTTRRLTPVDVSGLTSGVARISTGYSHTCAIKTGGALKCWGDNAWGQLGDNTSDTDRLTPVSVSGLSSGVTQVSLGKHHTCAKSDDDLRCWGDQIQGLLGNGRTSGEVHKPDQILIDYSTIDLAATNTCAVTLTQGAVCFGWRNAGAIGDDNSSSKAWRPTYVGGLSKDITSISQGSDGQDGFACALQSDGDVWCWGTNARGQLGDGNSGGSAALPVQVQNVSTAIQVTAGAGGAGHACALLEDSTVVCWGDNNQGQIGNGETDTDPVTDPEAVCATGTGGTCVKLDDIILVSAGGDHTCALDNGGAVLCWGDNHEGQLGDDSTTDRVNPVAVNGLSSGVVDISGGQEHTCAVLANGEAKCWGRNANSDSKGALGDGTYYDRDEPVNVCDDYNDTTNECDAVLTGVLQIDAGFDHTCAVIQGDLLAVNCWGEGNWGQLGDGEGRDGPSGDDWYVLTPVEVCDIDDDSCLGALSGILHVSSGWYNTCATVLEGGAACWGYHAMGQLGNNVVTGTPLYSSSTDARVPVEADDGDGCTAAQERGSNEALGGMRDPLNHWDFFDTPDAGGARDGVVTYDPEETDDDVDRVFARYFANDDGGTATPNRYSDPLSTPIPTPDEYFPAYDRSAPPAGAEKWQLGPPDGTIDLFNDIIGVANQAGHDCT